MTDVTRILERVTAGDTDAARELLPLVYDELRKIAAFKMAHEPAGHTLQPTALVHEAWLRMVGGNPMPIAGRSQFFGAAAEAMRRILVDAARRRRSLKRGGQFERAELPESALVFEGPSDDVLAVDEALEHLAKEDPVSARLVELRYFVGLDMPATAEALGLSLRSTERLWTYARAWLRRRMRETAG